MAKINYEKIEELLEVLLAQDVISEWRLLTPGQYRIDEKLDIYPKSKGYFWIETQERGNYKDLEDFLRIIF